jgi:hypothetical protein
MYKRKAWSIFGFDGFARAPIIIIYYYLAFYFFVSFAGVILWLQVGRVRKQLIK